MESNLYLENYISKINNINDLELKRYNFKGEVIIRENKEINPNNRVLRDYNSQRYKSLKDNNLNNDVFKIIKDDESNEVDLFDSDNFNLKNNNDEVEKVNFSDLDEDVKKDYISKYLLRKKYQIEGLELDKLYSILQDNDKLKKYINFSSELNQIVRIGCLKKKEDGTLYFKEENSKLKKKNIFLNKK